jgi:hypothetical protein
MTDHDRPPYHGHGDPVYLLIAIVVLAVWCAGLTFVVVK